MQDLIPNKDTDLSVPANILRLLSHPVRLSITLLLLSGPRTVSFLETHLALKQPNLSQHLAILRDANILNASRKAKSVTYEIQAGMAERILTSISQALPEMNEQAHAAPELAKPPETLQVSGGSKEVAPCSHWIQAEEGEAQVFATIHYPHKAS